MAGNMVVSSPVLPASPDVATLVRALHLRVVLALFAVHQVVMGIGAVLREAGTVSTGLFELDGEGHYYVLVSALLLLAGAVLAMLAVRERAAPRSALGLAALLAFMAADEAFALHERFEIWFDLDWPLLYSPIMAVGGVAVLVLLHRTRDVAWVAPAFLAGGACWAIAVVLEKVQWSAPTETGKVASYSSLMIAEELLEATGSFLLAVALLLLVRAGARAVGAASRPR